MKYKLMLVGLVSAMLASCSSAYKASQTPDDVYYSPARANTSERNVAREDRYEEYLNSQDDRYLRMKIRNRDRWQALDDYAYWNDMRFMPSLSYNYYRNNWNSFHMWNNPYAWNNWNSPFYHNPGLALGYNFYGGSFFSPFAYGYMPYTNVYISKYPTRRASSVNRPALGGYNNRNYSNSNPNYNRQGLGNTLRRVFTTSDNVYSNRNLNTNNNNNTYRAPERSYSPSSSSGSSSSGGSRSGGVSRPPR